MTEPELGEDVAEHTHGQSSFSCRLGLSAADRVLGRVTAARPIRRLARTLSLSAYGRMVVWQYALGATGAIAISAAKIGPTPG
jgi:hypothetical protein